MKFWLMLFLTISSIWTGIFGGIFGGNDKDEELEGNNDDLKELNLDIDSPDGKKMAALVLV